MSRPWGPRSAAGVGNVMDNGYFMPSLHLSKRRARNTCPWCAACSLGGHTVTKAASWAMVKLASTIGHDDRAGLVDAPLEVGPGAIAAAPFLDRLRLAVRNRLMLQIHYRDLSGCQSSRIVRLLGLTMFDVAWLRTSCCERSGDLAICALIASKMSRRRGTVQPGARETV